MLNSYFPPRRQFLFTSDVDVIKVLAFEMAEHFFALPISLIFKVINCPPISATTDSNLGITDFGGQTVTVVNLAQKLSPLNSGNQPWQKRFLILSKTRQGELCGIPINQPPSLIELPKDSIQPLPLSARQINPFSIATHVANMPKSNSSEKKYSNRDVKGKMAKSLYSQLSNEETSSSLPVKIFLIGMPE